MSFSRGGPQRDTTENTHTITLTSSKLLLCGADIFLKSKTLADSKC